MYNPKEYWKNELGGVEKWKELAKKSPNIVKSIERMNNLFIPKMNKLKKFNGGNILDAGCGSGFCSKTFLDSKHWDMVYGVDFQQHRIDFCKENYKGIDFRIGNLTNLPYEDSFFDTIYTGAVLMHLPLEDKIKAILEFKRVLSDDGFYFGHEVINNDGVYDVGGHVINPDLEWFKEYFNPLDVEILIMNFNNINMQIIYVNKK